MCATISLQKYMSVKSGSVVLLTRSVLTCRRRHSSHEVLLEVRLGGIVGFWSLLFQCVDVVSVGQWMVGGIEL